MNVNWGTVWGEGKNSRKKGQEKKNSGALNANKGSNFEGGLYRSREAARHRSGIRVRERNLQKKEEVKERGKRKIKIEDNHEIEKFQERKKRRKRERVSGRGSRGVMGIHERLRGVKNALEATPAFWLSHTILFNLVKMRIQPVECLTTGWFGIRQ